MTTSADVIDCAMSYVGTPFHWQGRSHLGLDCLGLVCAVATSLDLVPNIPRPTYRRPLGTQVLVNGLRAHLHERAHGQQRSSCGDRVSACCPDCKSDMAGTVVYLGGIGMQHCGIYTGSRLISVNERTGCVVVDFVSPKCLRAITRVFDFPGIG